MAIITRPTKTGGGTDVVAGNDVLAEEWNGDLNTIYTDYDGNITDANCSSIMGLVGTKLADAPNGVPTAKINDSAVTTAKIGNNQVTNAKINNGEISTNKLKGLVIESVAFNFNHAFNVYIASICRVPGTNYTGKLTVLEDVGGGMAAVNHTITPGTNIPSASKDLIAIYLDNVVTSGVNITGNVIFVSVDKA